MNRSALALFASFSLCLPLAVSGSGATLSLPAGAEQAAARIDSNTLLAPLRFLASDLLEGRGPGSRGDELARTYLAAELEALGYEPGVADGSYQQRFAMVGIRANAPERWTFTVGRSGTSSKTPVELARHDEFVATSGVQEASAAVDNAELVFVGYGIQAPEYQWDDFKGVDLKGKLLVVMNNDPDWDDTMFAGKTRLYYGRWRYKYETAARLGAAGAIIIHTTPSAGYPWQVVQTSWGGEEFELPAAGEPRNQLEAWITEPAACTGSRRAMSSAC
jgi:hypothetical protein